MTSPNSFKSLFIVALVLTGFFLFFSSEDEVLYEHNERQAASEIINKSPETSEFESKAKEILKKLTRAQRLQLEDDLKETEVNLDVVELNSDFQEVRENEEEAELSDLLPMERSSFQPPRLNRDDEEFISNLIEEEGL